MVNTHQSGEQSYPEIVGLADGDFIVGWQSSDQDLEDPDSSGWGIFAQRFNVEGLSLGNEFKINSSIQGSQYDLDITNLQNGDIAVSWTSDHLNNDPNIYSQIYDVT